jgi:lipopolysaccharide export system protein LptA
MPRGEKATLRADHGELTVRTADGLEPRKGSLWGNVRVVVDRTTDRWRAQHPEAAHKPTPQSQLVRVWLDRMEFDRERGRIVSAGDVRVESAEMQLLGRGLEIRWSDATSRIEYLKITEGRELTFQTDMALDLEMVQRVATGEGAESAPPEQEPAKRDKPVAPPSPPPVQEDLPEDVLVVQLGADRAGDAQITTYEVDFSSSVVARQHPGGGQLLADRLTVLLDMLPDSGAAGEDSDSAAQAPAGAEAQPAAEAGAPGGDQAAQSPQKPPKTPVHVTWQGPLVIRTVGQLPAGSAPLRREITALGNPVVAESQDGTIRAATLIRDVNTGLTRLLGSAQQGVRMESGEAMTLSARDLIELDESARRARLAGAVEIRMEDSSLRAEHVDADFAEPGPTRRGRSLRDLLERLDCRGDAALDQEESSLRCQRLVIGLAPDTAGRNLPRTADASEGVSLVSGSRQLQSQDVHVEFGHLPVDDQGRPLSRWPRTRAVHAREQVRIFDPQRHWDVAGQELRLTFDSEETITYGYIEGEPGQDARVELDGYAIRGASVTFDEARQWAHVPSAGSGQFMMEQDLDGRRAERPVAVEIEWQRDMTLDGANNLLTFRGGARAVSRTTTLTGRTLDILLEDLPPPDTAAAQSEPADPLNLWVLRPYRPEGEALTKALGRESRTAQPRRLRLSKRAREIVASGDADEPAELESLQHTAGTTALASRLDLRAAQIHFNLDQKVMLVDRPGRMSVEDYAPGAGSRTGGRSAGVFGAVREDGPSQTVLLWDSSFRYYYAQRAAMVESKNLPVQLVHLSGSNIVANEDLLQKTGLDPQRLEELRKLGTGRVAELSCGNLLVEFQPSSDQPGAGQLSFGQLRQFEARRNVILTEKKDGWYVSGDRVIFVDDNQLVEVHGGSGEPGFISRVDPRTGRRIEAQCPSLSLELQSGRVNAPDCPSITVGQ